MARDESCRTGETISDLCLFCQAEGLESGPVDLHGIQLWMGPIHSWIPSQVGLDSDCSTRLYSSTVSSGFCTQGPVPLQWGAGVGVPRHGDYVYLGLGCLRIATPTTGCVQQE